MNVPKLRFKEFNDEWSFAKLSEISSNISYGMGLASKEYDGINKYIRITDIDETTSKYSNNDIVSPDGELEEKYLVNTNDILFARTGASTGKTYLYDEQDGKLYFAGFLIRANIINHDANFIFQQTKTNKYNKWVKIMSMRSGQPGINSQEYGSYKFSIASPKEEEKISKTLKLLDKKIELQTKKIEDLKLFKKGFFSSQIKKTSNNKIRIKDILTEVNDKTSTNNEYDIISSTSNGIFLQKEYFNKQAASENNIGYKILRKNQLVLSPQNLWLGNINVNYKYDIGIVSPSYKIFTINTKVINMDFLNFWITTPRALYDYMISSEQGASIVRRNLNMELFSEIVINTPSLEIQNIIGKNLANFDKKILLETNKLEKLIKLKKGLMQNMFV